MSKHSSMVLAIAVATSMAAGVAYAQYPIMDRVAGKVIEKYQASSCQQLWREKAQGQGQPKPEMEQRAIQTVSYTHLDVYKRQPLLRLPPRRQSSPNLLSGHYQGAGYGPTAATLSASRASMPAARPTPPPPILIRCHLPRPRRRRTARPASSSSSCAPAATTDRPIP